MVSAVDKAKRVLVTLLKSLAGIYALVLGLTRDSTEVEVKAAYRKVSRRAHPDRGGTPEHQKTLNAARDDAIDGFHFRFKLEQANAASTFCKKSIRKIPLRRYESSWDFSKKSKQPTSARAANANKHGKHICVRANQMRT